jgi:hypothetical protein
MTATESHLCGRSIEHASAPGCNGGETAEPATRTGGGILTRLIHAPVDIASLAAFRFLFGLLMALAMTRFLAKGWVSELYVAPAFHFNYEGFDWVRPWPGPLMHLHFVLLAVAAIGVAAGFYYRICITIFFLGFTYVELIDQTAYLNHYYLISLLSGLMIFLPANRAWSIDVLRRPGLRLDAVPAWTLNILRFQIGVVFVFAGLAKLNADWLLAAQPLRIWLAARSDLPLLGPLLDNAGIAYVASWFGAVYDLSIVPFLLHPRTRGPAYLAVIVFHIATLALFNIGMFPWIMIVATLLFFSPGWPRRCLSQLAGLYGYFGDTTLVPGGSAWLRLGHRIQAAVRGNDPRRVAGVALPRLTVALLAVYATVQLALPLRPYLAKEPSAWSGRGFNLAWRVMIAEKTGFVEFYACDRATGRRWKLRNYLTPRQEMMMAQDPYLIRALARRLAKDLQAQGHPHVQIKVNAFATLNGRPSQRLIDSNIDLAGPVSAGWILALKQ